MLTLSTNDLTWISSQLDTVYMNDAPGADPRPRHPIPPASPVLLRYALMAFLGAALTALLIKLDGRVLAGEPLWLKPTKFFISSAIAAGTIEWVIRKSGLMSRKLDACRRVIAWGFLIEMVIICAQAARGVRSHFNLSTPVDAGLFTIMGLVITGVVIAIGVAGFIATGAASRWARAERIAVRWGIGVFVAAAFLGNVMVRPTHEQRRQAEAAGRPGVWGSHFVGSMEGATRTWALTGWSRESGDLRVPHFIGMHAIQVLLLLVFLAKRLGVSMDDARAARQMALIGGLLGGTWLLTLGQAFAGRSLFEPGLFQVGLWVVLSGMAAVLLWMTFGRPGKGVAA